MEAQSISLTHIRAAQLELVQEEAADNQKDARDQGQLMLWLCNESHLLFFFFNLQKGCLADIRSRNAHIK